MITPKIKALFQFIDYLHSNIDNFKQYDEVINELHLLNKERQKVSSKNTFKDKLKYDEVQEQIAGKFKVIQENIIQPIKAKATELNICNLNDPAILSETLWNWNITEILELKENFSKEDLPEIFSHKNKYLDYRTATKGEAYFLPIFFDSLDEILKELFDFFKETEQNEFESFEAKTVHVNNLNQVAELISGFDKWIIENGEIFKRLFPEIDKEMSDVIKEYISPFDFAQMLKAIPKTFTKRVEEVSALYGISKAKAIQLNIDFLENILFNYDYKGDSVITETLESLRDELTEQLDYWKQLLNEKELLPPPPTSNQNNMLSDLITHEKSIEIVEGIKVQYKNIKGKRLKLLLLALQDLELLPKERIAKKFYDSCESEFDWNLASYNAMNGYNFNDYTDSFELNSMKQYLETLIKAK